jgi:hypothetical protein
MKTTVRFRKKKLQNGFNTVRVELIHNFRSPLTGRPSNKCVGYLGSFREMWKALPIVKKNLHKEIFWQKADRVLRRLVTQSMISPADEAQIRTLIESQIPKPYAPPPPFPSWKAIAL